MTAKKVWKIRKREHTYREFRENPDDVLTDVCIVYDIEEAKKVIASLAYKHDTDIFVWTRRDSYVSDIDVMVRFSSISLNTDITFEAEQIEIVE